jgi:hypothetical protein
VRKRALDALTPAAPPLPTPPRASSRKPRHPSRKSYHPANSPFLAAKTLNFGHTDMSDTTANTTSLPGPSFAKGLQGSGLLKRRWLYHLLFWLAYYILTLMLYMGLHEKMTLLSCLQYLVTLFFQAIVAYINLYILIPKLLFEKKYSYYALALFLNLAIFAFVIVFFDNLFMYFKSGKFNPAMLYDLNHLIIVFIVEVYVVGMATGIKFLKDSFINQQWMKEKEKQYLETELKFLRSQIHPHFFFNTLNNIYSLTLKKSDEAPGIILKLSDLMSYMLYESNAPKVPLAKEIGYLQNYLDVEQLRFGQRLSVSFTREGFREDVNIPPMILILFLENSFKHGVKNNISKINIDIFLRIDEEFLYFKVDNPVTEDERTDESNKGIGLTNVRRRLDLLYGDDYALDILENNGIFSVNLKMPLC